VLGEYPSNPLIEEVHTIDIRYDVIGIMLLAVLPMEHPKTK